MSTTDRSMRADARRSHDAILAAAGELFAARGGEVQMDEIAERAGVGMGTLYRHFATKQSLLAAIIGRRFVAMIDLALAAEQIADPGASFETLLRSYLEAAERDVAFRYAILGPGRQLGPRSPSRRLTSPKSRSGSFDAPSAPATCEVT